MRSVISWDAHLKEIKKKKEKKKKHRPPLMFMLTQFDEISVKL